MEWMPPPDGIECANVMFSNVTTEEKESMDEVSNIGLDLAKRLFHARYRRACNSQDVRKCGEAESADPALIGEPGAGYCTAPCISLVIGRQLVACDPTPLPPQFRIRPSDPALHPH